MPRSIAGGEALEAGAPGPSDAEWRKRHAVTVKLPAKARRALAKARTVKLKLTVTAVDVPGAVR